MTGQAHTPLETSKRTSVANGRRFGNRKEETCIPIAEVARAKKGKFTCQIEHHAESARWL
jgi:hypothetical protein